MLGVDLAGDSVGKLSGRIADSMRRASTQSLPVALWIGSRWYQRLLLGTLNVLLLSSWTPSKHSSEKTSINRKRTVNYLLQRSSRRVIGTATSTASSRADGVKYKRAPSSQAGLKPYCPVCLTFESKVPVWVPKEKARLQCGEPQSTDSPHTSEILFDFRFSDVGTM